MIDVKTQALLQDILARERRSLLLYIGDAYPWTTGKDAPRLAALKELIQEEAEAVNSLGRFLARRRIPAPSVGVFPSSYTSCNFISMDYLLPRLTEAEKEMIAALAQDLPALTSAEGRSEAEKLLVAKRRTLEGLEALARPVASAW